MDSLPLFAPSAAKALTISELTRQLRGLLEEAFPSVWITGEISNLARPPSGHLYFSLKDADAQIRAVIWRSQASRLRFDLSDGLEVLARGRISVYAPRGDYQIQIEEIQPKGMGALELAFRQLQEKLAGRGWFAPERKKRLPRFPRRIALVTSPTGAAIRDMLRIIPRRWPAAEICLHPVAVQGDGAAAQIASAIGQINRWRSADVLIVGRGGGSLEDLWAFNEEVVAEAIFRSAIPIISAVGHQTDFTIADFVADQRAATPSEAAELVVPDWLEIRQRLEALGRRMSVLAAERLQRLRQKLDALAQRHVLRQPLERLRTLDQQLDEKSSRLARAVQVYADGAKRRLQHAAAQLDSLSPLNVLGRGYSLTMIETSETLLRKADQVKVGERIVTRLAQGSVVSRVEEGRP